jgi:hypothetical protein
MEGPVTPTVSRRKIVAWTLLLAIACPVSSFPQQKKSAGEDVNSEIEVARADLRADKVTIITEAMKFTPEESSAFWPIYKKYENDLSQLNDRRIRLIQSYADKFSTLTDADAKTMTNEAFDLESRRVDLKKRYFREFNEKLPASTVAKFFQLEHRLDLLIDLKIASELPSLLIKPASAAGGATSNK